MGTPDRRKRYLPWADDALLPGESAYAVLNKMGWFSDRGPVQLFRDLNPTGRMPSPTKLKRLQYNATGNTWKTIASLPNFPRIHEFRLDEYLRTFECDSGRWAFRTRALVELRFCPDCISLGMHFEVQQLRFIDYCPQHNERIVSQCKVCGHMISYSCHSQQAPFSCDLCNAPLLRDGLENLRDNYRERRQIARVYASLAKKLSLVPHVLVYARSDHRADHQSEVAHRHAITRLADSRLRGSPSPMNLTSPYVAVKVEQDETGRPRLRRITNAVLALSDQKRLRNSPQAERRLAQLRVGAWALQAFHGHRACICAGRKVVNHAAFRSRCNARKESQTCNIGCAFAAWEQGRNLRLEEVLNEALWNSWGLDDHATRMFAFYALEKACFGSAVMRFIHYDQYQLGAWRDAGFSLHLAETRLHFEIGLEQAAVWVDFNQIDLDDICEVCDRNVGVQMHWLKDANQNVPSSQMIQSLLEEYGTGARLAESGSWMDEEINRRVRLTLKSGASPS